MDDTQECRAAFEKWYALGRQISLQGDGYGGYTNSFTHARWEAWQAAYQARAQQDAERLREVRRQAEKIRETDTDGLPMWTFRATQGFADRQITLLDSIINESNANAGKDG